MTGRLVGYMKCLFPALIATVSYQDYKEYDFPSEVHGFTARKSELSPVTSVRTPNPTVKNVEIRNIIDTSES
jgi:hypothetical protein